MQEFHVEPAFGQGFSFQVTSMSTDTETAPVVVVDEHAARLQLLPPGQTTLDQLVSYSLPPAQQRDGCVIEHSLQGFLHLGSDIHDAAGGETLHGC